MALRRFSSFTKIKDSAFSRILLLTSAKTSDMWLFHLYWFCKTLQISQSDSLLQSNKNITPYRLTQSDPCPSTSLLTKSSFKESHKQKNANPPFFHWHIASTWKMTNIYLNKKASRGYKMKIWSISISCLWKSKLDHKEWRRYFLCNLFTYSKITCLMKWLSSWLIKKNSPCLISI